VPESLDPRRGFAQLNYAPMIPYPEHRPGRDPARAGGHPLVRPDVHHRLCHRLVPGAAPGEAARLRLDTQQIDDLIFYGAIGVIVGGRLGSILFYNFDAWLRDPVMLVRVWEGGMSFHGGMLGVVLAMWLYGRKLGRASSR
jgi:hypothetical protein